MWETASQLQGTALKEVRGEPKYTLFPPGNKHGVEHQKTTANHKEWTPQMNDFSVFLYMGGCKNLGLLKFFLKYVC